MALLLACAGIVPFLRRKVWRERALQNSEIVPKYFSGGKRWRCRGAKRADAELKEDMEYGEAINSDAFQDAVAISARLRGEGRSLAEAASQAVAEAYCVCVTEGEDAAEHGFSQVHRKLIDDVIDRLRKARPRADQSD